MTNHPTQGLQDMTLDLSTYSDTGLKELQTRIEEEKSRRGLTPDEQAAIFGFGEG